MYSVMGIYIYCHIKNKYEYQAAYSRKALVASMLSTKKVPKLGKKNKFAWLQRNDF